MRPHVLTVTMLLGGLLSSPLAWAASYAIDKDHTTVSFKIRHLFSYVQGTFNEFEGTLEHEPGKPQLWKVNAAIQAAGSPLVWSNAVSFPGTGWNPAGTVFPVAAGNLFFLKTPAAYVKIMVTNVSGAPGATNSPLVLSGVVAWQTNLNAAKL